MIAECGTLGALQARLRGFQVGTLRSVVGECWYLRHYYRHLQDHLLVTQEYKVEQRLNFGIMDHFGNVILMAVLMGFPGVVVEYIKPRVIVLSSWMAT